MACCCSCSSSGMKLSKPVMKLMIWASQRGIPNDSPANAYRKLTDVPYVENGDPAQVLDIYYADSLNRRDEVLIDIHGGFYVAGKRQDNRNFAAAFLEEGYDVVLLEYRLNDGKRDVSDELSDCAAALDFLWARAEELSLDRGRMFLTGDSAGGHLALYLAEGSQDTSMPLRPSLFTPSGVLLNCPAYNYASFSHAEGLTEGFKEWFLGPRYKDAEWMESMSPKTFVASYTGPVFISTCTNDFIRSESLSLKADREAQGLSVEFLDIESDDKEVGHVHNVANPALPASKTVNAAMISFMQQVR